MTLEVDGASVSTRIWVRYVRREIRDLDREDQTALINAMGVLVRTNDADGVDKVRGHRSSLASPPP